MVEYRKKVFRCLPICVLRLLIFLPGLIGPVLTTRRYIAMDKSDSITAWQDLIIPISIGYGASVVIAILIQHWIKDYLLAVLIAIPTCLFMYGILMIIAIYVGGNPKVIMWLPVILLFIGINGLPMAFFVSVFTISALRYKGWPLQKSSIIKGQ